MSATPNPSWYDLLGVRRRRRRPTRSGPPGAPQIADLDPTDRRFAVLNQAAEVLLDPDRRAAYDAELAAAAAEPEPEPEPEPSRTGSRRRHRERRRGAGLAAGRRRRA